MTGTAACMIITTMHALLSKHYCIEIQTSLQNRLYLPRFRRDFHKKWLVIKHFIENIGGNNNLFQFSEIAFVYWFYKKLMNIGAKAIHYNKRLKTFSFHVSICFGG